MNHLLDNRVDIISTLQSNLDKKESIFNCLHLGGIIAY